MKNPFKKHRKVERDEQGNPIFYSKDGGYKYPMQSRREARKAYHATNQKSEAGREERNRQTQLEKEAFEAEVAFPRNPLSAEAQQERADRLESILLKACGDHAGNMNSLSDGMIYQEGLKFHSKLAATLTPMDTAEQLMRTYIAKAKEAADVFKRKKNYHSYHRHSREYKEQLLHPFEISLLDIAAVIAKEMKISMEPVAREQIKGELKALPDTVPLPTPWVTNTTSEKAIAYISAPDKNSSYNAR